MAEVRNLPMFQGTNSTTFHHPPLDGSLTVPELYAHHARNSPHHPLFIYHDKSENKTQTIYYPEAYRAIQRAAAIVFSHYSRKEAAYIQQNRGRDSNDPPTFGILATADTITYATLTIGIMHSGCTPFPISTRNSVVGVAHLMRETGIRQVFVSPDPAMQRLCEDAIQVLGKEGIDVEALPLPQFPDLYNESDAPKDSQPYKTKPESTIFILHSSGSTAQPKPIKFTTYRFLMWGITPYFGEIDICGRPIGAHSLPMFHAMGAINMVWSTCSGSSIAVFKPSSPPVIPTPDVFFEAVVATQSEIIYCVPAFVEAWARNPNNMPDLKKLKAIIYGGAPMNKTIGDYLTSAGVAVVPFYGSTEVGCFSMFVPHPPKADEWQFFKISGHLQVEMLPQEGLDDIFEPVVIRTTTSTPNVINTVLNGKDGYLTSDLLQRHPTKPNFFRVYGRADDQLVLSTGEKTNPGPLETLFLQDSHITAVIMFGHGHFQNGVLVQPKEPFDPNNMDKLVEFRNKIWPTVEKVNEFAPSHSRIFKEMIIVTNPDKPLEFTPKGTPRRQVCLKAYSSEIDSLYRVVGDSSQAELKVPDVWTANSTMEFVRLAVVSVMGRSLSNDDDLFQQGCDSLQATWIRNTIRRALRASATITIHDLPLSFVYSYPTIGLLSDFVWKQFSSPIADIDEETRVSSKVREMETLVRKLEKNLPSAAWKSSEERIVNGKPSETVLLTGCTGRFGCHLLSQLVQNPKVLRVFALNREANGSATTLEARQHEALERWGLGNTSLEKVTFVVCDFVDAKLGINYEVYQEIQQSITTVIHNAWHVDFNLSLSSFGPLLSGVHHLIDLALGSSIPGGPHVLLVSSISAIRNQPLSSPAPEAAVHAKVAVGSGYSESKWVAEQLLRRVAETRGLSTTIVRVGQLCGDTRVGGWGPKEWVPALIGAGQVLGCIPQRNESVSWIPVDVAASALLDMSLKPSGKTDRTYYILAPRPTDWNTIFTAVASRLNLPLIPYADWLAQLEGKAKVFDESNSSPSSKEASAISLLDFFKSGDFGETPVVLEKSLKSSEALSQTKSLGKDDADRFLDFWNSEGFIDIK